MGSLPIFDREDSCDLRVKAIHTIVVHVFLSCALWPEIPGRTSLRMPAHWPAPERAGLFGRFRKSSAQHPLLTLRALRKLARYEDDGCPSQEKSGLNRAAIGNTGNEPGGRHPIQYEVAQTEQEGANSGKQCQDP